MHHDSGTSDGHSIVSCLEAPGCEFQRQSDGVEWKWIIRGTVPKIKDVYADRALSGQSLSAEHSDQEGMHVTHSSLRSATARTFSGGYAA